VRNNFERLLYMIYLVLIAGIAWYLWSQYGNVLTEKFTGPSANEKIIDQFPMIAEMLGNLPMGDTYTALVRKHTSVFLEHFQKSFVGTESKRFETTTMKRSRNKIERYIREILFRLPNDLNVQIAIERDLVKLLRVMQLMIDDVKERWHQAAAASF
jgi:hypothetical protein